MARRSQLEGRLLALLNPGVNRKAPGHASALAAVLLTVAVVAPLAALQSDVDATIRAATGQKNYDMLENAAKIAESLQKYDLAQKLLQSALAIRAEVSGLQSVDYALGLLKLGDLERRRGQSQPEEFYDKAISVLGNRLEAAPALIYLGAAAIRRQDFEQAIEYLESAQRADPTKAGPAMMWMAVARENQTNFAEADSLYKRALEIEPDSTDAATTMELYAQFLERQGREDEANAMKDRAATLRKSKTAQPASLRQGVNASVHRVGNGVTPPSLVSKVEPEYTDEARIAKYQGTVVLYAEISPEGAAHNLRIMRGLGLGLDEKAIDAINQWKFKPGIKDGTPVTVAATIEVNYRLN
jgi:TonB family protein